MPVGVIGIRADDTKEIVALADGYSESVEPLAGLLRDAKRCGTKRQALAVGDDALGFWGGPREVSP